MKPYSRVDIEQTTQEENGVSPETSQMFGAVRHRRAIKTTPNHIQQEGKNNAWLPLSYYRRAIKR